MGASDVRDAHRELVRGLLGLDDVLAAEFEMISPDGEEIAPTELSHGYSPVELGEITQVLKHLRRCQQVLLAVAAGLSRNPYRVC